MAEKIAKTYQENSVSYEGYSPLDPIDNLLPVFKTEYKKKLLKQFLDTSILKALSIFETM